MVAPAECFVIAEAGVNHNGSDDLAFKLVDVAAEAGADAVKFQSFRAESLTKPGAEKAEYQKDKTGDGDQLSMLKKLELSTEMHHRLKEHCHKAGIEFLSTPFDEETADFLVGMGIKRFKVPSGELTNLVMMKHLARKNLPMILSTGMGTIEEIHEAVETIRNTRENLGFNEPLETMLTLLHCTSNYPAALSDINLRAMQTMQQEFNLPVGYSDHSEGLLVPVMAVAMGAGVIEKHFTLDRSMPGPDHAASVEPNELKTMVENIRATTQALGSSKKTPTPSELPIRDLVRKSVTLKHSLSAGQSIKEGDLVLLRPGTGILPRDIEKVLTKKAAHDLPQWHTLQWSDLE
ncbi:MAG: N-acetylneuraminate synthase [Candidatus Nitronauta litoralis]|uniref:N-acetylneuraminate synthase n=1 Tax=Candidatus Nitronauta litoralis TaxID=2705533 RepID=A0A7T0BWY6_9BACT|nr:MAG: N-acetylneuraminate synthase [Candidatus Nitronauta litoralis]